MKTQSTSKNNSDIPESKAEKQASTESILHAYKNGTTQLAAIDKEEPVQQKENKTGLPDNLKSGVENLSGHSLDDVKVHYNSSQPATLQAHAFAQGTDIHVAPGQEKHLPHEAWHVVQQKQGRVQPTKQLKGKTNINDDAGLEKEADVMGAKAMQMKIDSGTFSSFPENYKANSTNIVQRVPTGANAATFDQGLPNYTAGVFASTDANVLTTRANHNNASAPADPVNRVNIRAGHSLASNYQADGNLALTVNGAAPILNAIQQTPDINGIANPHRNAISNAAGNRAIQAGATAIQIATAAQQVLLNAGPAIVFQAQQQGANAMQIVTLQNNINTLAGNFYNNVLNAVPVYGATQMAMRGGISAGNAGNQLTRIHIIHHALGAGTNNNGNNIFWGNPGFNNPQILVEETRMLNFLNGGAQTFNGNGLTLANSYFGGNHHVVAHNGLWYSPTADAFPVKTGNNIAGALYNTINAAFGNANVPYRQVNTASLPRTGDYSMNVDYNQHNTANMQVQLANALVNEYNNRANPLWVGENDGLVAAMGALMLAEAQGSISSQVTVTQEHQSMAWNQAPNAAAAPNSAIPVSQATTWQVVANYNNPVMDNGTPRFRLATVYRNANNAQANGGGLYNW